MIFIDDGSGLTGENMRETDRQTDRQTDRDFSDIRRQFLTNQTIIIPAMNECFNFRCVLEYQFICRTRDAFSSL